MNRAAGPFEIIEILGEGSFGTVCVARVTGAPLRRRVALGIAALFGLIVVGVLAFETARVIQDSVADTLAPIIASAVTASSTTKAKSRATGWKAESSRWARAAPPPLLPPLPAFGSGIVKVTPAHDPNDYEAGLRHQLERVEVIKYRADEPDG